MQPTKQAVHVDRPLTTMSVAYMQRQEEFIGGKIFPVIPVEKASDLYYTFPKDAWFRDEAKPRAVGSPASSSGYDIETDNYSTNEYAHRHPIYDRVRDNADNPLNVDRSGTNFVSRMLLMKTERLWVSSFFTTGIWGTDKAGVASAPSGSQVVYWSDDTNGDPVGDVDTAKQTVLQNTGFEPNTGVIGYEVFNKLKESAALQEKIKYGGGPGNPAIVTAQALAQIWGIERLFIAKSIVNTANEGATIDMSFNFGKKAWFGYVNPSPAIEMPSAGYTFAWTGVSKGIGENVAVKRYRDEELACEWIEASMALDMKLVGSDLGYFFDTIIP